MRRSEFFSEIPWAVRALGIVFLVVFVLFWAWLQGGKYRPDDVDDAWSLPFCYDYVHHGIEVDRVSGSTHNQAGVQYFGKTYAYLTAKTLDLIGWTKTNGHILPLLFLLAGAGLWVPLLRRLGFSAALAFAFAASVPLWEPFFSTAVCARSESFLFMMASLAALLFVRENYLMSALVIGLSGETHPTGGLIALFYVLAVFWGDRRARERWNKRKKDILIPFLSGAALSGVYFAWLHFDILPRLASFLLANNSVHGSVFPNFLRAYFFETKFHRHLPELAIFLAAAILYFRRGFGRSTPFLNALLALSILFSLVLRHPNFHYTLYCFPAFLLLCFKVAELFRKTHWLLAAWLVLLVPQYGAICYMNRTFDLGAEVSGFRTAVPADGLPVLGPANAWYAFFDRDFYFNVYAVDETPLEIKKFYLIEDANYLDAGGPCKRWIEMGFIPRPLRHLSIHGREFSVLLETARKPVAQGRDRSGSGN